MASSKKIRVLLAQTKLDSHGVGLRYIGATLRDAGMEVIIFRYGVIEEVIKAAIEESVDVIGLSYYSAGMEYEVPVVMKLLKEEEMEDTVVIVGGIVNEDERKKLIGWGVKDVFTPGRAVEDIVKCILPEVTKLT